MRLQYCSLAVVLASLPAQETQAPALDRVSLRLTAVRADGRVQVDRGTRDRVMVGDRVVMFPLDGRTRMGSVVEVDERTAIVELDGTGGALPAGTKGEVLVPRQRARPGQQQPGIAPGQPQPQQPEPVQQDPEMWRPGMALLAGAKPIQSDERSTTIAGRAYFIGDFTRTLGNNVNSFLRTGTDLTVDNPGGEGGALRFHGEYNQSLETSYNNGADLRLFDLSYTLGGTRWTPLRFQAGRFLQSAMPELGLLDGIEVSYRTEGGDRYGGSFGWMPLLDDDMKSFEDMQIAAYYIWTQDVSERLTWGFAVQKSWHQGKQDRDLAVIKTRCVPPEGWEYGGTLWIDFYNHAQDNLKSETVAITRANAYTTRSWKNVGGALFTFNHEEYPELRRQEFWQTLLQAQISSAHHEVLSAQGWLLNDDGGRWHGRITGWGDEQKFGGSAEVGVEVRGLLMPGARADLTGFISQGLDSTLYGIRANYGRTTASGRWDAFYELSTANFAGFPPDRSDILQHRLAGSYTDDLGFRWNLTLYGGYSVWEGESTATAGVYLQKFF